jgi:hypothetical protein
MSSEAGRPKARATFDLDRAGDGTAVKFSLDVELRARRSVRRPAREVDGAPRGAGDAREAEGVRRNDDGRAPRTERASSSR